MLMAMRKQYVLPALPIIVFCLGVRDVASLNADASLADLGLDSLMGVEVRQTLERDYDIVLAMRDIRLLTINKLRELSSKPGGSEGVCGVCVRACICMNTNLPRLSVCLYLDMKGQCYSGTGQAIRRLLVQASLLHEQGL